jgi:hypothetical protein
MYISCTNYLFLILNSPRFKVPVVNDASWSDRQRVPVAVWAEGESGVITKSSLARRIDIDRTELAVAFGTAIL